MPADKHLKFLDRRGGALEESAGLLHDVLLSRPREMHRKCHEKKKKQVPHEKPANGWCNATYLVVMSLTSSFVIVVQYVLLCVAVCILMDAKLLYHQAAAIVRFSSVDTSTEYSSRIARRMQCRRVWF